MGRINKTIPGLYNGVSQQVASLRLDNQCEAQKNMVSDVAFGLTTRPGTRWQLNAYYEEGAYVQEFEQFDGIVKREFFLIIRPSAVTDKVIIAELLSDGNLIYRTVTVSPEASGYLSAGSTLPYLRFRQANIADACIVTNRDVTVSKDAGSLGVEVSKCALIQCITPTNLHTYNVNLQLGPAEPTITATYTSAASGTPSTTVDADLLADAIVSAIDTEYGAGTAIKVINPVAIFVSPAPLASDRVYVGVDGSNIFVYMFYSDTLDIYACTGSDSYGNQGMRAFALETESITNLPYSGIGGYTVKITGNLGENAPGYYVTWDWGLQRWVETTEPYWRWGGDAVLNGLLNTTMPIKIQRSGDSFSVDVIDWTDRDVGDDETVPFPSFTTKKISDVFFYENRLGFLSNENAFLSKIGDYFNLFATTATDILDDDPIDIASLDSKTTNFRSSAVIQENLFLFTPSGPFKLSGSKSTGILSPSTVTLKRVTSVSMNPDIITVYEDRVFFVDDRFPNRTRLYAFELVNELLTFRNRALNNHCPSYLEGTPRKLIFMPNLEILIVINSSNTIVDTYREYRDTNGSLIQAAFSKWEFPFPVDTCIFMGESLWYFYRDGTNARVMRQRFDDYTDEGVPSGTYLENEPYLDCMEHCAIDPSQNYKILGYHQMITDFGTVDNLVCLVTKADDSDEPIALPVETDGSAFYVNSVFAEEAINDGYILDIANDDAFIGIKINREFTFSKQYVKFSNTGVGFSGGSLTLRSAVIQVENTGKLTATVSVPGRDDIEYDINNIRFGHPYGDDNKQQLYTGLIKVAVGAEAKEASVTLESDDWKPMTIHSAIMEMEFNVEGSIV